MDKIIEALENQMNDKCYIEHPVGSNAFTLKREDRRQKTTTKSKKYVYYFKNWSKECFILWRKNRLRLLKKLKKSKYAKNSLLFKLIYLADNKLDDKEKVPTRADYVEKREIDRSNLYNFDGSLQLIHADVANLELLGKNVRISRYVLLVVDLYSLKVYVYPMRSRKQILQKMKLFYDEIKNLKK